MTETSLSSNERAFLAQADAFVRILLKELGVTSLYSLEDLPKSAVALEPVLIKDVYNISGHERSQLLRQYEGPEGVAYFILAKEPPLDHERHPLFVITSQLAEDFSLQHPLEHPLENHPTTVTNFGGGNGTVKVYDLPERGGDRGYREQGETAERFEMHHDGLGSGGTVDTVILYTESAPLWGGFTYFQHLGRLSLELAKSDFEAFQLLFLPDALTVIRPRGKGALRVTGPVLYINERLQPQSFFRRESGEYQVRWRKGVGPLNRAREFLEDYARPFACGSSFLHFTLPGEGCIIQNRLIAHGRTRFLDDPARGRRRVLARKWFMRAERDSVYKHVPGLFLDPQYARLFPQYFGAEVIEGEWNLTSLGKNERVR